MVTWQERGFDAERRALYRAYQGAVHAEEGASDGEHLHLEGVCPGGELHARDANGRLLALSIIDRCDHGLSSVYCYYDPELSERGLGTFMVLAEVAETLRQGLVWLYLGFSIDGNAKMRYKQRFGPHQRRENGRWQLAQ